MPLPAFTLLLDSRPQHHNNKARLMTKLDKQPTKANTQNKAAGRPRSGVGCWMLDRGFRFNNILKKCLPVLLLLAFSLPTAPLDPPHIHIFRYMSGARESRGVRCGKHCCSFHTTTSHKEAGVGTICTAVQQYCYRERGCSWQKALSICLLAPFLPLSGSLLSSFLLDAPREGGIRQQHTQSIYHRI